MEQIDYIHLDTETMQMVTTDQAWHYKIIPKKKSSGTFECYIDSGQPIAPTIAELELLTGKEVVLDQVDSVVIENTLNRFYLRNEQPSLDQAVDSNSEEFVSQLISEAKGLGTSDIHLEAYESQCRVRMRLDGKLVERYVLGKKEYPSLVNKIKIMSNLDIAEKRLPQDGRIFYQHKQDKFDIRVSVLPTLYGEKIVLRLLGSDASEIDIHQLGFSEFDLANYLEGIKKPNGILLISGPTGSGKTTTLYATLKLLNEKSRNVITIEDPIEYTLEGINQVQLRENIGLDFSRALRTFLRQDPDVIMVGEIRDTDTADMAIRAALTGHLVLSTIHTNSAWGTISRLIDMDVPSYLLANTLNTTVAQRLLRLLCPKCKEEATFSQDLFPKGYTPSIKIDSHFKAKGCNHCYHSGYKGRKAVYEVITIDRELAQMIKNKEFEIGETLKRHKIKTLAENAFEIFKNGETTIDEIYPLLLN